MQVEFRMKSDKAVSPIYKKGTFEITGLNNSWLDRRVEITDQYHTHIEIKVPDGYYYTIEGNNNDDIIKTFVFDDQELVIHSKNYNPTETALLVPHKIIEVDKVVIY